MDWHARVRKAFAGRPVPDDDIVEELAEHAADAWQAAVSAGNSERDADDMVDRQLAAWAQDRAEYRRSPNRLPAPVPPAATGGRMTGFGQEVRYAIRLLRRQPGHSVAAVATMALGLGAAAVIVSVLYGVLIKPLPWPNADRLVRLTETRKGGTNRLGAIFTNATYRAWRESSMTLDGIAGWAPDEQTLTGAGEPRRVTFGRVTASLFPLLNAQPALGRLLRADDEPAGKEPVVLISHALWVNRFGGDTGVVGRTIQLNREPYRIVGVMPAGFAFPDPETEAWLPMFIPPTTDPQRPGHRLAMFRAVGLLKPGVTAPQAAAEGSARGQAAMGNDPPMVVNAVFGSRGAVEVSAVPLLEYETAKVRPALLVFLAAVALLLVTATANVASLQLTRATGRRREMAIRAAVGAGTWRLVRQSLIESTLLALLGGLVGLLFTAWLQHLLPTLLPSSFPRVTDIGLQAPVLATVFALTFLSGLAFGLLPALQASRVNLVSTLAEDGTAPVGSGYRSRAARARTILAASQVAIGCVLLIGGTLLGRSFLALLSADRGYNPEHVLTAGLSLPDAAYSAERRVQLLSALLDELRRSPGVTAAGLTTSLPLRPGETLGAFPLPAKNGSGTVRVQASLREVSPGYFETLGYRLVSGRTFAATDTAWSQPVVIVNRAFARQYLPEPAVGQRLPAGFSRAGDSAEVIGVVEDVRHRGATDAVQPELYRSYLQLSAGLLHDEPTLAVRTTNNPNGLLPVLRQLVVKQDPTLVLTDVMTMTARVSRSVAEPRLYAVLLVGFAAFAVAIAAVGLFGVLAYGVAQRSRELGVRAALGARPTDIVGLVVRHWAVMTFSGLALGVAVSFALLRLLGTLLYGVTAYDPWTYAGVTVGLLLLAALACAVPARRAARLDPLKALRS